MPSSSNTKLAQGNAAYHNKDFSGAIRCYVELLTAKPTISKLISVNLTLARNRYREEREKDIQLKAAVCGWELSHNAAERVYTLAELYKTFTQVNIIGCHFSSWGREVWPPIRDKNIPIHSFVVEDEAGFIEQALQLVATHPYDLVHLSNPRMPNVLMGMLYKLVWGTKVVMDIDDEELAFVETDTPIRIEDYLKQHHELPALNDLIGRDWTRLAVGLAKDFDGVTVSSPALQQYYGGDIIRHAQDEKLYEPSPELKHRSSGKYGMPLITPCSNNPHNWLSKIINLNSNRQSQTVGYLMFSQIGLVSKYGKVYERYSSLYQAIANLYHHNDLTPMLARSHITKKNDVAIDIVVTVFNSLKDVERCLESLEQHTDGFRVHVIVVNDGSGADTTQWLRQHCTTNHSFTLIEHPKNLGYTRAVNTGLKASAAEFVITQNSDTIVTSGWLAGMVRCMNSDSKIGVVGPLSNAASWQNVPNLLNESGDFAINDLPLGLDANGMAQVVTKASKCTYPRVPFVNGFCFMIRRAVIDAIGYMDEENFPVGYGEENDFCIRAIDAGFELAIADDVFVFHAKSKSFGHNLRKILSQQGTNSLKNKHTPEKFAVRLAAVKKTEYLDAVRSRIQGVLQQYIAENTVDIMSMRILFLLPVAGGSGGAHSVVQEVAEMRRLGLHAQVAMKYDQVKGFLETYTDIPAVEGIFVGFDEPSLIDLAENYDVIVGTIFNSMNLIKKVIDVSPNILPAYYVQDYEPLFFEEGSAKWYEARDSYTIVPGALLFAKTQWIINEVERHHGVIAQKVQPSIDHEVYKPSQRRADGHLHVTAMIRPQTPRRGAGRTMHLLYRLYQKFGDNLTFHVFGCESNHDEFQKLERGFPFVNHGILLRPQVATLLSQSDLFIDLSDYQAFGRTALEAMACGCAAVVPVVGGADEYAVHGQNAVVLDTLDEEACFDTISKLLANLDELLRLRRAGLATAAKYSVHSATISECLVIEKALTNWRKQHPFLGSKSSMLLLPSTSSDQKMVTGSGYVRVMLPYRSPTLLKKWKVKYTQTLPSSDDAEIVLIQREAPHHSFSVLKPWLSQWKGAGRKLIFELDDDMLDVEGLIERGYKGDVKAIADKVRFLASEADLVHVSTEFLAQRIRPINHYVRVIPNALDAELWQLGHPRKHDHGIYKRQPNGPIRIGYIGTPTHDADLDLITEAMKTIENKYGSDVEIEIIGGFQNRKPTFGKRVGLPKKRDYPNFVRWLQERVHWDIGVIPLIETEFNKSKSFLKFLECAALDMALVVSDVPTYRLVVRSYHNCLLAKATTEDWVEKLSELIENEGLRLRLAQQARSDCSEKHTLDNITPQIAHELEILETEKEAK